MILTKELDLQIAIAPTLMTVHGWASPIRGGGLRAGTRHFASS